VDDRAVYERALGTIRDVFSDALEDGRADLVEHQTESTGRGRPELMPWFEVRPTNERACVLSVTPQGNGMVVVGLGRAGSWTELWASADENLAKLGQIARAVRAGRYDEDVRGEQHVGRVRLDDEEFVFGGNVVRLKPRRGVPGWTHHTYEPY
jgi:hypothetical protein